MLRIEKATVAQLSIVNELAHIIWPPTFGEILSEVQLAYMLNMMYSLEALYEQICEKKHVFLLAYWNNKPVGFASYELNYEGKSKTKLHKIYVLPTLQGKGVGKSLLLEIYRISKKHNATCVRLNVNKYNISVKKYETLGFSVVEKEVIDIGNGYVMDDYVMEKKLTLPVL